MENALFYAFFAKKKMLVQEKAQLREYLKQQRLALTGVQRRQFSRAIHTRLLPRLEQAARVFCYLSTHLEVGTRGIIDELSQTGKTVLVPKILNRDRMIATRFDGWDKLQTGQLGILTPDTDAEWPGTIDLCITPGLGFSATGDRIGYGRGYYDKWFAKHPQSIRLGLCYECQLVEALPVTATDVRLHGIITEERIILPAAA